MKKWMGTLLFLMLGMSTAYATPRWGIESGMSASAGPYLGLVYLADSMVASLSGSYINTTLNDDRTLTSVTAYGAVRSSLGNEVSLALGGVVGTTFGKYLGQDVAGSWHLGPSVTLEKTLSPNLILYFDLVPIAFSHLAGPMTQDATAIGEFSVGIYWLM